MPKSSTPRSSRVKPLADPTAFQVDLKQVDIHQVVRLGLEQFVYQAGLLLVRQVMEAEATQLAGQRYARSSEKTAHRHGCQPGSVYLAGQKVAVEKPRVRTKSTDSQPAQEVPLESYQAFAQPDAMNAAILERLLAGVSCRDYARTVETVIQGHGISKSAVSRKAIAITAQAVEDFYNRKLDTLDLVVVLMDGIQAGGVDNIVCLGIDSKGHKHVLGLRQGATENHMVCRELLAELVERGLSADRQYLFVLDGGKALAKAVHQVFGKDVALQRCQVHKKRLGAGLSAQGAPGAHR